MPRSQDILGLMDELKLVGMKATFDEVLSNDLKRQHPAQQIIGELLAAEIAEKQARSIRYRSALPDCRSPRRLPTLTSPERQSTRASCAIWRLDGFGEYPEMACQYCHRFSRVGCRHYLTPVNDTVIPDDCCDPTPNWEPLMLGFIMWVTRKPKREIVRFLCTGAALVIVGGWSAFAARTIDF
jgi:hypothetical protein